MEKWQKPARFLGRFLTFTLISNDRAEVNTSHTRLVLTRERFVATFPSADLLVREMSK